MRNTRSETYFSPVYTPQSNGCLEGWHRFFKACIAKHIHGGGVEWDELVPLAVSTYNFFPCQYKARYAHKRLYTVLPKYSKIQVLPGITSCRWVKDNKQAIELNSLLLNNMPKDGYG